MQPQAEILSELLQTYYPRGCRCIDFTFGTGSLWWKIKESPTLAPLYPITACDAAPNEKLKAIDSISQKNLLTDNYSELGLHDVGVFDPPYLIGRPTPFSAMTRSGGSSVVPNGFRSWDSTNLARYTSNPTVEDFNRRVDALNRVGDQAISPNGLLLVKVMDIRNEGHFVTHHISVANILSRRYDLVDIGVYVTQRPFTWKSKQRLQGTHGFWEVFRLKTNGGTSSSSHGRNSDKDRTPLEPMKAFDIDGLEVSARTREDAEAHALQLRRLKEELKNGKITFDLMHYSYLC